MEKVGAVLVVGGGIAGMQSSLDLADAGFKVYLIDKSPSIGGVMSQLDKTFPTNDCAMCIMAPKLVGAGRHLNITTIPNAEVEEVKGQAGNFKVLLKQTALRVDPEKCTGCGVCLEKCPVETVNEYNEGLDLRGAINIKYPQAVPLIASIKKEVCIGCGICSEECKAGAVVYDQDDKAIELDVGSIILAPGFDEFDPGLKSEYGYGRYCNVISSIEFERILSASGPYGGVVARPSDGEVPKKVAFIQCVGSRDEKIGKGYCSSVCCMYATKEAVIAREHVGEFLEATIFFMDMRAYGKDFDKYIERAKEEYGVRYIRSRVPEITEDPETHDLRIRYESEDGELREDEFNLVVLSVGLSPSEEVGELAGRLGIELNEYEFCRTDAFNPVETSRPGVLVAGAFQNPKDIPESVCQASGASAKASELLSPVRGTLITERVFPEETDVLEKEPRIGVFVCNCGINIGGYIDVPSVAEYAKTLDGVAHTEHNLFTCSQDTQGKIREAIEEHDLNRVIVASCTPRTHEPLFRETIREAGLNPYLFEMANIRDQCSWVHMSDWEGATRKAKDLIRMAVAKSRMLEPLYGKSLPVNHAALVIGGGLSGMTAALSLAEQGFDVHLVEREAQLGGNLAKLHYLLDGYDPREKLRDIVERVNASPRIDVYTNTSISAIDGFLGNFTTTLKVNDEEVVVEHGAVVVAVGAHQLEPTEYLHGEDERVLTQLELEKRLAADQFGAKTVVMIQCVGSREEERPYCSRLCCSQALKSALKIKEKSPETDIYILYRDMRTYGFKEFFYEEARRKGISFIRYDVDEKPQVSENAKNLDVVVRDPVLNELLLIKSDLVVLSPAIVPHEDAADIAKMLKIPLNKEGFFLEAHVKLRPVDFATEGVFLAGLSHSPKPVEESIAQALGAAARAATILSKDQIELEATVSFVLDANCDGCAYCVEPCPYEAITLLEYMREGAIKKTVEVDESRCKGCGTCMATCPKRGIYVKHFKLEMLEAMVEAALQPV